MHQALPVPARAVLSASRMDRAATMSREFWKRNFVTEGAIARGKRRGKGRKKGKEEWENGERALVSFCMSLL